MELFLYSQKFEIDAPQTHNVAYPADSRATT
jgi:hypothetical protein